MTAPSGSLSRAEVFPHISFCRSVVTGKIDENGQSFMMDSKVHLGSDRRFLLLATRVSRLHTQRLGIWVERCYHAPSARRDVGAGGW